MGLSTKLFFSSIFVGLLAVLPSVLEFSLRVRFPNVRRAAVLVTGASKGIGRDVVDALLDEGMLVYAGVRKKSDFDALKALDKPRLRPVILDVNDQASVDAAYDLIVREIETLPREVLHNPALSAIVNNAAWGSRGPIEFTNIDEARKMFETNVFGAMRVTQKFLPQLRKDGGRVVMVSSLLGKFSVANFGIYCATKHALEAIADSLRQELLPVGVSVSVIEPGVVDTPFHETAQELTQAQLPPAATEVYPHLFTEQKAAMAQRTLKKGAKPREVSLDVVHAIVSYEPKTRYPSANWDGIPGWLVLLASWAVPDRLRDRLLA